MSALPGPQLLLGERTLWRRELEHVSTIHVAPGDRVEPDTLLAEGPRPAPPVLIPLSKAEPLVPAGSRVRSGEPIGRRKRMIGRGEDVLAPVAGTVLCVVGDDLVLQPPPVTQRLLAQLPGIVASVTPGRGVDLEGTFGLLMGHAGAGTSEHGRLGETIAVLPDPLTVDRLRSLASQGVRAVIGPSWAGAAPAESPLPYLLTELLPDRAMATPLAEALQRHLGQSAAVQFGLRPMLAFALHAAAVPRPVLQAGAWVRLPDGAAARLLRARGPQFFPSGIRATAAEVDLGDRTEVVPFDGLEWVA